MAVADLRRALALRTHACRTGFDQRLPAPVQALQGEAVLRQRFHRLFGYRLDTSNPRTFTEKLYCRMIAWHRQPDPRAAALADKYSLRTHVAARVGEKYCSPMLWHTGEATSIPFDALPTRFILKASHGCKYVIRVEDPVDREAVTRRAHSFLSRNFYWAYREPQYRSLQGTLMAERWVDDDHPAGPIDYMFYCFEGTPAMVLTGDVHGTFAYQDLDWRLLDVHKRKKPVDHHVARPENLEEMVSVASRMARDLDFVRVDMLRSGTDLHVNELTFTPSAGLSTFKPAAAERWLGSLWQLEPVPGLFGTRSRPPSAGSEQGIDHHSRTDN